MAPHASGTSQAKLEDSAKPWDLLHNLMASIGSKQKQAKAPSSKSSSPRAQEKQAASPRKHNSQQQQQQQNSKQQQQQARNTASAQQALESIPQSLSMPYTGLLPPPPTGPARKTLVLDLDHTLIDCLLLRDKHAYEPDFTYTDCEGGRAKVWLRPALMEFLREANRDFEVVLFTAAGQRHADAVLGAIDPNRQLVGHRLYGVHTVPYPQWSWVKDLSRIGRDLSQTLLVDDCAYAALAQPENWLSIKPYDHAAPRARSDRALLDLLRFLREKVLPAADVRVAVAQYYNQPACRPRRVPAHPHLTSLHPASLQQQQLPPFNTFASPAHLAEAQLEHQRRLQWAQEAAAAAAHDEYAGVGPNNAGAGAGAAAVACYSLAAALAMPDEASDCELSDGEGEHSDLVAHLGNPRAQLAAHSGKARRAFPTAMACAEHDPLLPLVSWCEWLALLTTFPHHVHHHHHGCASDDAEASASETHSGPATGSSASCSAVTPASGPDSRASAASARSSSRGGSSSNCLEAQDSGALDALLQAGGLRRSTTAEDLGLDALAEAVAASGLGGPASGTRRQASKSSKRLGGGAGVCSAHDAAASVCASGPAGSSCLGLVLSTSLPGVLTPTPLPPGVLMLDSVVLPRTPPPAGASPASAAALPPSEGGAPKDGARRSSAGGPKFSRRISSDGTVSSGGGAPPPAAPLAGPASSAKPTLASPAGPSVTPKAKRGANPSLRTLSGSASLEGVASPATPSPATPAVVRA